jgi:hypothetical protein
MSVPYALHAKTVAEAKYDVDTFYAALGGYVIEVSDGGKHGLGVAMQDQGTADWYTANSLLSNVKNHDANGAKFKDWRVPSRRELSLMYLVYFNDNIPNLNPIFYWSSQDTSTLNAWGHWFLDGISYQSARTVVNNVRAVRAF